MLISAADQYESKEFCDQDPIQIPHLFQKKQDVEIAGLFAAILSWGLRKTIINKARQLMTLMDDAPYEFIMGHQESDLQVFEQFKHRTFQPADTLYFIHFLREFYSQEDSLEFGFRDLNNGFSDIKQGLMGFRHRFFQSEYALDRTKKHIPSPERNSACKRLNMYLRWMVRSSDRKVDFGIWQHIKPHQLYIPLDVHVQRIAVHFGLLTREKSDWKAVEELTHNLQQIDPKDPVRFDFALFNLGLEYSKNAVSPL